MVCAEYGCLPSAAEAELANDPDLKALTIIDLRRYAAAKGAFDAAEDKVAELTGWRGNRHMSLVELNTMELRQARRADATSPKTGAC